MYKVSLISKISFSSCLNYLTYFFNSAFVFKMTLLKAQIVKYKITYHFKPVFIYLMVFIMVYRVNVE